MRGQTMMARNFQLSTFNFQLSTLLRSTLFALALLTIPTFSQAAEDKQATFFMGRIRYSSNDGNDCGGVGQDLMRLVSRASTLKIQDERKVKLTDPDLFET